MAFNLELLFICENKISKTINFTCKTEVNKESIRVLRIKIHGFQVRVSKVTDCMNITYCSTCSSTLDVVDAIVSGRGGVVDDKGHSGAITGEGVVGTGESVMLNTGHTVLLSSNCSKQNGLVTAIAVTMLTLLSFSGLSGKAPNVR